MMNDNFTDRLLDASLQQYSRVTPTDEFASRVLAQPVAPRRTWLAWLTIPATAAALAGGILMMHPVPMPAPPLVATFHACVPVRHVAVKRDAIHPPPFHTLTAFEMARMTLPAELFATHEEKPITEIVIPELTVAPLEIPTLPEAEGEKP
jgi:hypothetical protein